jgi:group I intron endonuclease
MIGIYKITSPTNRIYIGQSVDIERRFRFYRNLNCKGQPVLYSSMLKYGSDSHTFEIIEECSHELLNVRERYWQDFYCVLNGGLNCHLTSTDELPKLHSQETKDKIAKSHTGKTFTQEHRDNLSATKKKTTLGKNNNFFDKHHTPEFKKNLSNQRSGSGNPKARLVLNLETGIYYDTALEVSIMLGINRETFGSWLRGKYPNKTSFIYV